MGVIDKTVYTLTCNDCGVSEESRVLDRGSGWGGSVWDSSAYFAKFDTEWEGGGPVETILISSKCKNCGSSNIRIESSYKL